MAEQPPLRVSDYSTSRSVWHFQSAVYGYDPLPRSCDTPSEVMVREPTVQPARFQIPTSPVMGRNKRKGQQGGHRSATSPLTKSDAVVVQCRRAAKSPTRSQQMSSDKDTTSYDRSRAKSKIAKTGTSSRGGTCPETELVASHSPPTAIRTCGTDQGQIGWARDPAVNCTLVWGTTSSHCPARRGSRASYNCDAVPIVVETAIQKLADDTIWHTNHHGHQFQHGVSDRMQRPQSDPSTAAAASLLWAPLEKAVQNRSMPTISQRASPPPYQSAYIDQNDPVEFRPGDETGWRDELYANHILHEDCRQRLYLEHLNWINALALRASAETLLRDEIYTKNLCNEAYRALYPELPSHRVDHGARPLLHHCPNRPEDHYHSPTSALMRQIDSTPCPQYQQPRVVSPLGEQHVVRALSPHALQNVILEELRVPHPRPLELGDTCMPSATLELSSVCRPVHAEELLDNSQDAVVSQHRAIKMSLVAASAHRIDREVAQSTTEPTSKSCHKSVFWNDPASCARRSQRLSRQRTINGDLVHAAVDTHHGCDSTVLDEMASRPFHPEHHISPEGTPTTQIDNHFVAVRRKIGIIEDSSDYDNELLSLMNEDVMSV
jgi:hypothetical protein